MSSSLLQGLLKQNAAEQRTPPYADRDDSDDELVNVVRRPLPLSHGA